jgi:hypothetical protein
MLRKSIYNSPGEPSFFYLMMAESCFRRAARHPHAGTLRNIGRDYLTKATKVTSILEPRPSNVDFGCRAIIAVGADRKICNVPCFKHLPESGIIQSLYVWPLRSAEIRAPRPETIPGIIGREKGMRRWDAKLATAWGLSPERFWLTIGWSPTGWYDV